MKRYIVKNYFYSNCLVALIFPLFRFKTKWKISIIIGHYIKDNSYTLPHFTLYNKKYFLDFGPVCPDKDKNKLWFYGSYRIRRHNKEHVKFLTSVKI